MSHNMFEYQFTELPKHGYRCIGIDLRGFGDSDKPWDGYNYDIMADDVKVVLDTLILDAHWVVSQWEERSLFVI